MERQTIPTLEQAYSGTLYGAVSNKNQICMISPDDLIEIDDQPFLPYSREKLKDLSDSIQNNGQQEPCIVRKMENGDLIILSGRNRKRACELIGCKVKCVVITCSDAEANLILTDTNLYQRHELLPSELAKAYRMQKEAYEAKGERKSTAAIAERTGESRMTIQRYIKLSEMQGGLLNLIDTGRIPISAGFKLADQPKKKQEELSRFLGTHPNIKVNLHAANQLTGMQDWNCNNLLQLFEKKPKSPSRFEQVMPILCDQYCRYSVTGSQEELEAHCEQCVLAKMLEQML